MDAFAYEHACVIIFWHVYCLCVSVFICVCVPVCNCLRVYMFVCIYVCVHMCLRVYMFACVCVCVVTSLRVHGVCVCTWMLLSLLGRGCKATPTYPSRLHHCSNLPYLKRDVRKFIAMDLALTRGTLF